MLMQPTKHQRRLVSLRNKAANRGLRVHLQPLPGGATGSSDRHRYAAYCLPWANPRMAKMVWVLTRESFSHELHAVGEWDWQVEPRGFDMARFRASLEQAPDYLMALASGPQGLCAYWSESGNEEDVETIANWLHSTAAVLAAKAGVVIDIVDEDESDAGKD